MPYYFKKNISLSVMPFGRTGWAKDIEVTISFALVPGFRGKIWEFPNLVVAIFTRKRSFALFCALSRSLRTCVCAPLRAFALFCGHLRSFACICVFLRTTACRTTALNFGNCRKILRQKQGIFREICGIKTSESQKVNTSKS